MISGSKWNNFNISFISLQLKNRMKNSEKLQNSRQVDEEH